MNQDQKRRSELGKVGILVGQLPPGLQDVPNMIKRVHAFHRCLPLHDKRKAAEFFQPSYMFEQCTLGKDGKLLETKIGSQHAVVGIDAGKTHKPYEVVMKCFPHRYGKEITILDCRRHKQVAWILHCNVELLAANRSRNHNTNWQKIVLNEQWIYENSMWFLDPLSCMKITVKKEEKPIGKKIAHDILAGRIK